MVVALRERLAKEMFLQLSEDEREGWKAQAKEEHDTTIENWTNETQANPIARQKYVYILYYSMFINTFSICARCIEGLVGFSQLFLDLICRVTGWESHHDRWRSRTST